MRYVSRKRTIIDTIVERLKKAKVTDAQHFFKNPFREIAEDELPCVKIGILGDDAEWYNNRPEYKRSAQLVIVYSDQGNDELADKLQYMGERIENFMIDDDNTTQVDGVLDALMLKGTELNLENAAMGIGAIIVKFDITFYTEHLAKLDDLETINVKIKPSTAVGNDTENPPVFEDTITLPTE